MVYYNNPSLFLHVLGPSSTRYHQPHQPNGRTLEYNLGIPWYIFNYLGIFDSSHSSAEDLPSLVHGRRDTIYDFILPLRMMDYDLSMSRLYPPQAFIDN